MFSYHGGLLWVDLINTEHLHDGQVQDLIRHPQDWLDWFRQAGVVAPDFEWNAEEDEAGLMQFSSDLQKLRRHLRHMADALVQTGSIAPEAIAFFNTRLTECRGAWQLQLTADGYEAAFLPEPMWQRLEWQVLQSVLDFLTKGQWNRLKRCNNHQCIQYYFDTSKNNTRRWCRMETCGNREKARRHYQKSRHFLENGDED